MSRLEEALYAAGVQVAWAPTHVVAALSGKISAEYALAVREQLRAVVLGGRRFVLVDLSEVTEIDSHGLGALVALVKLARERGGAVRCCGAPPPVYALLVLTRLHQVLDCYPARALALREPWEPAGGHNG
jgi:anti-sigma B factor antagonist